MKKRPITDAKNFIKETGISLDDLPSAPKKNYSPTRTTFNLRKKTLETFSLLCTNYGMKQKDFIDEVVVPTANEAVSTQKRRDLLFKRLNDSPADDYERKTFVLSTKSLNKLNNLSKETGIIRDKLFAVAVYMQKVLLDVRHEKYLKAIKILEELADKIEKTEQHLIELLGDDNPIPKRVSKLSLILDYLDSAIDAELNRGVPIDPDDLFQQR